ncbi:MAG: 30S ribosomal protein S17 [Nanoarchaeota archaeon]
MAKTEHNCKDAHCALHGSLSTHGRSFVGTVINSKMQRTANVEWARTRTIHKFERTATERSRVKAHNPDCLSAKKGDLVKIQECKPLSKTKTFVITEILGQNIAYLARERLLEEAKMPVKKEEKEEAVEAEQ